MNLDVKYTIWGRFSLPDDTDIELLKARLQDGLGPSQAIDEVIPHQFGENGLEYELLHDSEELMLPEENEGLATIELFEKYDDAEPYWSNRIAPED